MTLAHTQSVLSHRRQRLFRWAAVLLLPLALLICEVVLREAGWGYATHFFIREKGASTDAFVENPQFGWRFFPPRLARAPDPLRLSKRKPPGTIRVFVFGESAALGDPEPAYGFGRILRELLEERCPGTRFEVVNVAMTAISSHAILSIAQDCVPFQGDIWIFYMGNNEVVGPFGAASVFGAKAPPMSLLRTSLALKRTRLGQLVDTIWQRARLRPQDATQWEGMKMMLNEQIRATDPVLERIYQHFEKNLRDMVSTAKRAGAKPILCSVATNQKDCPPFVSLHAQGLSDDGNAQWTRSFAAATEAESRQEFAQALALYRQAAEIDETYALLPFRMARCFMALGQRVAAQEQFARACDLDALRFRADTSIEQIIRRVYADRASEGVRYFDAQAALTNACALGILGEECFWDHVHLNFTGNYRVASRLAEQVITLLPEAVRSSSPASGKVLTEAQCADRLAFTDWDRRGVLERMWRREHEPPFTGQLDHEKLIERWSGVMADLDRKTDPAGLARAIDLYRKALEWRSDDWLLHHRFAFLLEATGDYSEAERHWKRVVASVPGFVDAWFKLGDMSARQSRFAEARDNYRHVLQLRPASFEAFNGLGLVFMSEGKLDDAARCFQRALGAQPKFAQAHVNWGLLLSQRGNLVEAEAHFREALRCGPEESAGAHVNLGNLLATQQKYAEAMDHYSKALLIQPKAATVHLSLGNCLAAVGRTDEALAQYREATQLDATLPEAQFNLGVALARRGDLGGATHCFQEAVRLAPLDPQAHLNLGVALAQQNQLREAIAQFQEVLRLNPSDTAAKQYLQTAIAREKGTTLRRDW